MSRLRCRAGHRAYGRGAPTQPSWLHLRLRHHSERRSGERVGRHCEHTQCPGNDVGEHRRRDLTTVVEVALRLVEHDDYDEARVRGGGEPRENRCVSIVAVATYAGLLRGARLTCHVEIANRSALTRSLGRDDRLGDRAG